MKKTLLAVGMMAALMIAEKSQATLIDRGNGLVYDDVNNISWTKVAGDGGLRTWSNQVSWADGFSLAGFDDFRLANINELASLYGQLPGAAGSNKTGDISPFEGIQSDYWSGAEVVASRGASSSAMASRATSARASTSTVGPSALAIRWGSPSWDRQCC